MTLRPEQIKNLRRTITEGLRIQRDSGDAVPYIDTADVLGDVCARQNHAIFARRGCGKTLLLHYSRGQLSKSIRTVYLNCEDFKRHSFPNVLIEVLDALFGELERHLPGWFGRKKKSRLIIGNIRNQLQELKSIADTQEESVRERGLREQTATEGGKLLVPIGSGSLELAGQQSKRALAETEKTFVHHRDKLKDLDAWLPRLKEQVRDFFSLSTNVTSVFLQIDDLYHLRRYDQPFVVDYLHRLCKDVPLYFKIATLRHASLLYIDLEGQPIGAQERHDFQPLDIDYSFVDFKRTRDQNKQIFYEFGKAAKITRQDMDGLFKGAGFDRLVMAGGGVPRDTLSLFLDLLSNATNKTGQIGKDDVRILSKSNFERRINELKQDADGSEQGPLLHGIYALRSFCLEKKSNVFFVAEQALQQHDDFRELVLRLLDYRIIHHAASALTHKSQSGGTYQAFAIDLGCYAHLRKLDGRFNEIDVSTPGFREKIRSSPVFDVSRYHELLSASPEDVESALLVDEEPG